MAGLLESSLHGCSRAFHCGYDTHVSGTATQVAVQCLYDLRFGGLEVALEQADGSHYHARGAVTALQRVFVEKRLLNRVESAAGQARQRCAGFPFAQGRPDP
jgi:hypothetical protein